MTEAQKHYQQLRKISENRTLFQGIASLLNWDQETMMPPSAATVRGQQLEAMAGLIHKLQTGPRFRNTLGKLVNLKTGTIKGKGLTEPQKTALQRWHTDYVNATALPLRFVEKFAKETVASIDAWRHAKSNDDFSAFAPHLQTMVDLCRKKADYLKYDQHPYDALIKLYEPGMTTKDIDTIFSALRPEIGKLLKTINRSKQIDDSFLTAPCSPQKQLSFSHKLLAGLGYDSSNGRLDTSAHPFSSAAHPTDSRITTRIDPKNVISNISAVLHECGHSLYEMGLPVEEYGTPLGEAVSHGIHESQSRWWETRIGLSKPYWHYYLPLLKKEFKGKFDSISLDRFYRAINKVAPSFIRIEADEVTYPLHIILRFELEKELIAGTLKIKDVPEAWNAKMTELLGIRPQTNKQGCLQDIHWSMGGFGYFPTYTLGNLYAAQLFEQFAKDHPDWEKRVEKGQLLFIREWLAQAVYRHGRLYEGKELVQKVTGKPFQATPYYHYLQKKYKAIYS